MDIQVVFYDERVMIRLPSSYKDLIREVHRKYQVIPKEVNMIHLVYFDEDKDKIILNTDNDLEEFKKSVKIGKVKELMVELLDNSKSFDIRLINENAYININKEDLTGQKCCNCFCVIKINSTMSSCKECGLVLCSKCRVNYKHKHQLYDNDIIDDNNNNNGGNWYMNKISSVFQNISSFAIGNLFSRQKA